MRITNDRMWIGIFLSRSDFKKTVKLECKLMNPDDLCMFCHKRKAIYRISISHMVEGNRLITVSQNVCEDCLDEASYQMINRSHKKSKFSCEKIKAKVWSVS